MNGSFEPDSVLIVGAGVFGVTAALELARRGVDVVVLDPGPLPTPNASSTDISKVLRMDYGADEFYSALMEQAFLGWEAWGEQWPTPLFHQDGFLLMTPERMQPGEFEYESFQLLRRRGHPLERVDSEALGSKYANWDASRFSDGYFNPRAGWVESGRVVAWLARQAVDAGARLVEGRRVASLLRAQGRVVGVETVAGDRIRGRMVVVAAGAWTSGLLPEAADLLWPVAQPVLHFHTPDAARFQPPAFPPWAADISHSGFYGFPALPDGTLKIANHGRGWQLKPGGGGAVPAKVEAQFRTFLSETFPGLAGAPLIESRFCFYCDTWDGDFLIDRVPGVEGLVVASGGSGHAFKFAPVLGALIADVVEGRESPAGARFAWRRRGELSREQARSLYEI